MTKGFEYKSYIPLALKLVVIIWVAGRLSITIESNTTDIRKAREINTAQSQIMVVNQTKIEIMRQGMTRLENKIDKLLERN